MAGAEVVAVGVEEQLIRSKLQMRTRETSKTRTDLFTFSSFYYGFIVCADRLQDNSLYPIPQWLVNEIIPQKDRIEYLNCPINTSEQVQQVIFALFAKGNYTN